MISQNRKDTTVVFIVAHLVGQKNMKRALKILFKIIEISIFKLPLKQGKFTLTVILCTHMYAFQITHGLPKLNFGSSSCMPFRGAINPVVNLT